MRYKLLIGSCLALSILSAEEDCCTSRCPSTFSIGGNWIYMRPLTSDTEYARVIQTSGDDVPVLINGERECVKTKYSSGYEFFASYQCPMECEELAVDLKASFLSNESSHNSTKKVAEPYFITSTLGLFPNSGSNRFLEAEGKVELDLSYLNGEIGLTLFCFSDSYVRFFAGVSYADLKQKFTGSYQNPALFQNQDPDIFSQVIERSKFAAAGPRIGFNVDWGLFCGFGLFGDFASNLYISKKRGKIFQENFSPEQTSETASLNFQWQEKFCAKTALTASLEAKGGLSFCFDCFDCFTLDIRGGFQVFHFFDALELLKVAGNDLDSTSVSQRNLNASTWTKQVDYSLIGWFIGGQIRF